MSGVIVCMGALRRQNSDIDEDVARVFERTVADRLDTEVEKIQGVLEAVIAWVIRRAIPRDYQSARTS